ncbi:hypothetical protein L596_014534 [Steinernema carpocapsae]|uniref:Uncharacterized protein n=1 Tax=Steinernema carpocapsae TaxID=34508 RepID=A0A4U5NCR2_STECR|nr:hypothetical protein L596_014534 [Steinernema carpocapsae]
MADSVTNPNPFLVDSARSEAFANFLNGTANLTPEDRIERRLKTLKVDAMCAVAATDGTLTKIVPCFGDICGVDPNLAARAVNYPDFESFLDSAYVRDAIQRTFQDDGKKIYALKPDRGIDHLHMQSMHHAEVKRQRAKDNARAQEIAAVKGVKEEKSKRFRYEVCKVVRDLGGMDKLISLQALQEAFFRRHNKPLDRMCWRENFGVTSAQRALHHHFINELSCTIAEQTSTIQLMLKRPFSDIKIDLLQELKDLHGVDVSELEAESVEPQPLEQFNVHLLTEGELEAMEYFMPSVLHGAISSEEVETTEVQTANRADQNPLEAPAAEPMAPANCLAQRAMLASVKRTEQK